MTVEIEYFPLQKIVIHDIELTPLDKFIDFVAAKGGIIGWCDGLLFSIMHFPNNPDLVKEAVKGINHWQVVEVAKCEKYKSEMRNDSNQKIKVLDQSHNIITLSAIKKVKEVLKIE